MRYVVPGSLAATLDGFEAIHFDKRVLPNSARRELASFIASRFEQPGSYGGTGMPAPTERDFAQGVRVFTGERACSWVGTAHILGEEACRALLLLDVHTADVLEPLARATRAMVLRLAKDDARYGQPAGHYCCCTCSVALWRQLVACGLDHHDERLRHGVSILAGRRTGDGRWKGYPFYYTLLALLEMTVVEAQDELEYAAARCAAILARGLKGEEPYATRRRVLLERVLARCDVPIPVRTEKRRGVRACRRVARV